MRRVHRDQETAAFRLTQRDLALLRFVSAQRMVTVNHIAVAFFGTNPIDGSANTRPERACLRRLRYLQVHGCVWLDFRSDGVSRRQMVTAGPNAERVLGANTTAENPRPALHRIPPRRRAHHVKTLDAVALLDAHLARFGARIVSVKHDAELRAEEQKGRRLQRGEKLRPLPDAVCVVESRDGKRRHTIVIEYVTSKYCDADIREKHESFARFPHVLWCADRASTAARVTRLTGKRCEVLS